jgi:hypothetical protein
METGWDTGKIVNIAESQVKGIVAEAAAEEVRKELFD